MKISVHDIKGIQSFLFKAIEKGEQWMSYLFPGKKILESQSIETWDSKEVARQYCEMNNDEHLLIGSSAIEPFLQELHDGIGRNGDERQKTINVNIDRVNEASFQRYNKQHFNNSKKISTMNEKNYDYLSNQLKFTGFGEELQGQLKEKMQTQEPQFTLNSQKDYGRDQTVATLHFKKSDESDMYFFNRYSLMLKNDQHTDPVKQTFFISNKENNITLKEAYNLMANRSVHKELSNKEGEKYNAWLQMDFKESDANGNYKMKQFHQNYGYDLKAALNKYPIREMQNENDSQRLIESLQRGNRQSVTMTLDGKEQKVFVEAVPQFKSLNLYEPTGQRIKTDKLHADNKQEVPLKQERKQNVKQGQEGDDEAVTGKKKTRRKKQNIA
ncbi:MAG: hypothetical protein ABI237_14760 [Ginsengibacter sp.]